MKKYFKVGMQVSCPVFGNGVVEHVAHENNTYPIKVSFNNSKTTESFTNDGRLFVFGSPCLFQGHNKFDEPFLEEVHEFKQGDPVWATCDDETWDLRYYSHFENNFHHCFSNQKKEGSTTRWVTVKPFKGELP